MAANTNPIFIKSGGIAHVKMTAANTSRDGSGSNVYTLVAGSTEGRRINKIVIKAVVTTAAIGMVRFFLDDGTTVMAWREEQIAAATVSASVKGATVEILLQGENALILPTGWTLKCTTHTANETHVTAHYGDY